MTEQLKKHKAMFPPIKSGKMPLRELDALIDSLTNEEIVRLARRLKERRKDAR